MALVLSESLQKRIQAVVDTGVYSTAELALQAAVELMDAAAENDFDGRQDELQALLTEGSQSRLLSEDEFWQAADAEMEKLIRLRSINRKT